MDNRLPTWRLLVLPMLIGALAGSADAAPGATSPYATDTQHTNVEDATSRGVNQVNMIMCFMSAMRPDALVNKDTYVALVDKGKCDPESRSSTSNSGATNSGSNAPSYMRAIVDSSRTSNDEPMRVRTWVEESERDFDVTIFVNTTATEPPSDGNPYGVFRLDYCGKADDGPCMMRGFLEGSAGGISYYEIEPAGPGGSSTKALQLTKSGPDSGAGVLQIDEMGQQIAFSFAYNADYFRRSNGVQDQCFTRDADDPETGMSVWRYGLYDAGTGERVTRQSGFPIEYEAGNGTLYHGHIGYWGLWLPEEAGAGNGATVQRVQYVADQPPTKTAYTLLQSEGRLMKYSKRTRTLAAIDKIKFYSFVGDVAGFFEGAQPNKQYEVYWDNAAGVFKVTGVLECTEQCQTRDLSAEQSVLPSYFANKGGARGWSQALGGEVYVALESAGDTVDSTAVEVIYRVQDLVYPSQMPATLFCLRDCPTAASMAAFFADGSAGPSPYLDATFNHWEPSDGSAVVSYTTDAANAVLKDHTGSAVTFTDGDALASRPQYQWGVRSGRLFAALSDAACDFDATKYCDHELESLDTYYQWETGPNQWNQFAVVKDGNGAIVSFDPPLQVNYEVPSGAAYGQYAGKSIVLEYGGFGELWGIPGHCVSRLTNERVSCETPESRYVPAFVIPFDETLGRVMSNGEPMLVKWLDREIRFARKDPAVCAAAGVTLPSELTLPSAAGLQDPSSSDSDIYIGAKPAVSAAPRVIHGDVKF
ncbi:hypothetical protein M8A51_25310 [Schlegelella sp. S2-27]|uniref:Uncharacterized protein n=1 Tax=Caldimonas mangrovi TaxID=2944811 RepID=A0ABT0YVT6_9BURK|nr:hypothetical protein [Caldimonas mangrovi]MCM5682857.1 hypothetical protein [Caldimonas mangrovi]